MKNLRIYTFPALPFGGSASGSSKNLPMIYFRSARHHGTLHSAESFTFIKDWFSKL